MNTKQLKKLYAGLPDIQCKGLCVNSCGPIGMARAEAERIADRVGCDVASLPVIQPHTDLACPHLSRSGRCKVYDVRPLICRLWGVAEGMECPHGCKPSRTVDRAEGRALLARLGSDFVFTLPAEVAGELIEMYQATA